MINFSMLRMGFLISVWREVVVWSIGVGGVIDGHNNVATILDLTLFEKVYEYAY